MTIRPEDWEILGIEPGADIGQVRRAYRHRRSLYEPAALATYNLLDDEEREGMVDRIEEAYRRIIGSELPAAPQAPPPTIKPDAANEVVIGNAPDPLSEPGAHLRFYRTAKGFTLHQIAVETKIGSQIGGRDLRGLRAFIEEHQPDAAFVVCTTARPLRVKTELSMPNGVTSTSSLAS